MGRRMGKSRANWRIVNEKAYVPVARNLKEGHHGVMVHMKVEYLGGLRCRTLHDPSGDSFFTDAPVDNMGKGEAFSPTDLTAVALGSCIATTMAMVAERHQVELKGMKVAVEKEMVELFILNYIMVVMQW